MTSCQRLWARGVNQLGRASPCPAISVVLGGGFEKLTRLVSEAWAIRSCDLCDVPWEFFLFFCPVGTARPPGWGAREPRKEMATETLQLGRPHPRKEKGARDLLGKGGWAMGDLQYLPRDCQTPSSVYTASGMVGSLDVVLSIMQTCGAWWCQPALPALARLKQEDCKFESTWCN